MDDVRARDRRLELAEFRDLLRRDRAEIPDLHYEAELLVVEGEQVACRIRFDCMDAVRDQLRAGADLTGRGSRPRPR